MQRRVVVSTGVWSFVFCLLCVVVVTKLSVVSDISAFLPRAKSVEQQLLVRQLSSGSSTRLLLLAIEGGGASQRLEASKLFAQELQKIESITRIENGQQFNAAKLRTWAMDQRFHFSENLDTAFSVNGIRSSLERRVVEIQTGTSFVSSTDIARDPTLQHIDVLKKWTPHHQPVRSRGLWVNNDNSRALLVTAIADSAYQAEAQISTIDEINATFATLPFEGLRLVITGPAKFAADSKNLISSDVRFFSSIASLALLVLLYVVYRSVVYALLAALPLFAGVLAAVAISAILFSQVHGIVFAFGVTVLGLALDYPIHLFSRIRRIPVSEAVKSVWPTIRMGVITTILGYAAFLFTDLEGLMQLSVFAISGLASSALVARYLLPFLVELVSVSPAKNSLSLPKICTTLKVKVFAIGCVIVLGITAFSSNRGWLQTDLSAMSVVPTASIIVDRELRRELGSAEVSELLVVRAKSAQQVLEQQESLQSILDEWRREGIVTGYDLAANYLPSARQQHSNLQIIPSAEELENRVAKAAALLPLQVQAFTPFIEDAARARLSDPVLYSHAITGPLKDQIRMLLYPQNDEWLGIITLVGVRNSVELEEHVSKVGVNGVSYLNLAEVSAEMLTNYMVTTASQLIWMVLIIILVLAIGLRDPKRVSRVLAICLFGIATNIFAFYLMGTWFSVFHLVALMLVLGISLDYALFFTLDEFDANTFHSLCTCCVSTIIVFGLLACSDIPLINAIGSIVTGGIISCFIFGMVFSTPKT